MATPVNDPGLPELIASKMEVAILRAIYSTQMRLWQHIITVLIPGYPRKPVDRSTYQAGFGVKKTMRGATLYNTAPHAPMVENGVRPENVKPGRKMREAIREWLIRKQICSEDEADFVAMRVIRKMKMTGIFMTAAQGAKPGGGLQVMKTALKSLDGFLMEEIEAELKKEFR